MVSGHPAVVAQWQSTGSSSQRCPGFDSQQMPAFSLSSIFTFHLNILRTNSVNAVCVVVQNN